MIFSNAFLLGFLRCLKYICEMRILQSIFILLCLLYASNQCIAGIFDFTASGVYDHSLIREQTDLSDSYSPINLIHFFQRTEQVSYVDPAGREFPNQLFLKFGKSENLPNNLIPAFLFCTSFRLVLIFPKHYFF